MRRVRPAKLSPAHKPASKLGSARRIRSFVRQAITLLSAVIVVIVIIIGVWFYYSKAPAAFIDRWLTKWEVPLWEMTADSGLSLQNIYLEGAHHTKKERILEALSVKLGQPILAISLPQLKKRLEAIDWVKYAIVERQLPSTLRIQIIERKPLAIWQKSGKLYLVDDEGVTVEESDLSSFPHLLIMVGDDASTHARSLLKIIKEDADLYNLIAAAIRVGERRWNIRFSSGFEIKLPEKNMQEAWRYTIKLYKENKLFIPNVTSIDLRIADKLYMNMVPNATMPGEKAPK